MVLVVSILLLTELCHVSCLCVRHVGIARGNSGRRARPAPGAAPLLEMPLTRHHMPLTRHYMTLTRHQKGLTYHRNERGYVH